MWAEALAQRPMWCAPPAFSVSVSKVAVALLSCRTWISLEDSNWKTVFSDSLFASVEEKYSLLSSALTFNNVFFWLSKNEPSPFSFWILLFVSIYCRLRMDISIINGMNTKQKGTPESKWWICKQWSKGI
jgi:hypothetical protein